MLEVVGNDVRRPSVKRRRRIRATYSIGEAYEIEVDRVSGVIVHLKLVKNLRNEIKGLVEVIDSDGSVLLKVKYLNGLVRRSCGTPDHFRYVEKVLEFLKIPYRRLNLRTGSDSCASYATLH